MWESTDFVVDHQERMRCICSAIRENLRRCTERLITYDLRLRSRRLNCVPGYGTTIRADGQEGRESGLDTTSDECCERR